MHKNSWDPARQAWDRGYRRTGRRYGGAIHDIPPLPPGTRVLEAGCGDGKLLLSLAGRELDIVAVDFSREALSICAGYQLLHEVRFIQADARALPFRRDSFDAVFLNHLLGHVTSRGRCLVGSEVERILSPGGRIFVRVFSVRDFRSGKGILVEPSTFLRGDGIMAHYFSSEEVSQLFPGLALDRIREVDWTMKLKGKELCRSEIVAEFRKS